jgi:rhamnosyltransferase
MNNSPSKANTCAVIISFHPDFEILERIRAVSEEVNQVIVIDNGSNEEEKKHLLEILKEIKNSVIVFNELNIGIAKALNVGVDLSQKLMHDWILLLDQDSQISKGYIATMSNAYSKCLDNESVMSICPVISPYRTKAQKEEKLVRSYAIYAQSSEKNSEVGVESVFSKITSAITSGNLVRAEVFEKIGLFTEEYFIDYVDHEFNLRLSKKGFKLIQSNRTILYHDVGDPTFHYFLGKKMSTSNHSSLRRYYYYRNCIVTYKKYLYSNFLWVLNDIIFSIYLFAKIIFFEVDRKEKIKFSILGLWHGMTEQMGEFSKNSRNLY